MNIAAGSGRGAIGSFVINTGALINGLHSIAWSVTDDQGRTEGIGSRNFVVSNADDAAADAPAGLPTTPLGKADNLDGAIAGTRQIIGRVGFAPDTPYQLVTADGAGIRHLRVPEADRVELDLGGPVETGYLVVGEDLFPLPVGSHVYTPSGRFTWAPVAGFLGPFDLIFVTPDGRIPVRIEIVARASGPEHDGLSMWIDSPAFSSHVSGVFAIAGWALDPYAWTGTGIDAVHVWATRTDTGSDPAWGAPGQTSLLATPVFLGAAQLGGARPDVAAAFGAQFDRAGYSLTVQGLTPGVYDLVVYAHSAGTGQWEDARSVRVTIER